MMSPDRITAQRSRKWAARRAFVLGLPEAVGGLSSTFVLPKVVSETFHIAPVLSLLTVISLATPVAIRGIVNIVGKYVYLGAGPDSAQEYYQAASKWRRRAFGLGNIVVPFDIWKASTN